MEKLKNYLPLVFTFISLIFVTLIWEQIEIPYTNEESIYGDYEKNNYNPSNDTLRFIIFTFIPLFIYLFFSLKLNKKNYLNFSKVLYDISYEKEAIEKNLLLEKLLRFTILVLLIEFLTINFEFFTINIDHPHHGMILTPSNNAFILNEFWKSSYIERGLIAQFGLMFIWKIFEVKTIGMMHLMDLSFLFLNKILIVYLSYLLSLNILLKNSSKIICFVLLTVFSLTLVNYYELSNIPGRLFLILLFLVIFYNSLSNKKYRLTTNFFMGTFSLFSMLWFIDIGAYLNVLLIILILFYFFKKKFQKIFIILLGILTSWLLFYIITPSSEFKQFLETTILIYSTVDFYNGLIFPTPFYEGNIRGTRALLFNILAGMFVILFNLKKGIKINNKNKIFLVFLFISSILIFKTALSRSDTPHIKSAIGLNLFIVFYSVLFFLLNYYEKRSFFQKNINIFFKNLEIKKNKIFFIYLILILGIFNTNINQFKNIHKFPNNIKKLALEENEKYIDLNFKNMITYYSNLSKKNNCVQILSNEASIPYFMNKPTCTKFYFLYPVAGKTLQLKFIEEFKDRMPEIILYNSKQTTWKFSKIQAPFLFKFIDDNYVFHSKFENWTFHKLK